MRFELCKEYFTGEGPCTITFISADGAEEVTTLNVKADRTFELEPPLVPGLNAFARCVG